MPRQAQRIQRPRKAIKQDHTNSAGKKIVGRYVIVSTFIIFFATMIAFNLFQTTVVHAEELKTKANKELSRRDTIYPVRGDILAADGSVLATNLIFYTARVDFRASKFDDKKFSAALDHLCDTLAMFHPVRTKDEWKKYIKKEFDKDKKKRSRCFTLLRNLSYDQAEAIKTFPFFNQSKNSNRTGLVIESECRRSNPFGDMARRSVGRVGESSSSRQVHGYSGLEYALDSLLFGKIGFAKKVPLTDRIVNWADVPAIPGKTLKTTIDIGMQDIVEHELTQILQASDAEWGTVILMEVGTGDIKAISNLERDKHGNYIESMNHAVLGYEPGSVVKTLSMVVALEEGFTKDPENEIYNIERSYQFGSGPKFSDTHSPSSLPVSRFLEYSSNIGMTKLVGSHFRDNPDGFRQSVANLGFFEKFNTGIAGERPPYFPKLSNDMGGVTNLGRQTFGYNTQISPLYMCALYNAIANDGMFVRPRLVSEIHSPEGDSVIPVSYINKRMCSPRNAEIIREMLHKVIYGPGGTARRLQDDLVDIAGKTGTSRVAREMSEEDRLKLKKNPKDPTVVRPTGYIPGAYRYAFCGFFPFEKPKYTCMVLISRPGGEYASAPKSSGQVVLNIGRRLYSRGLLGSPPDYKNGDVAEKDASPVMYATTNKNRDKQLSSMLASSSARRIQTPEKTPTGTVPSVRGLGLREAIVVLEKAGFNVSFEGDGSVTAQTPVAGSAVPKGSSVRLSLTKN